MIGQSVIDPMGLVVKLWSEKLRILIWMIVFTVIGAAYAVAVPPVYTAKVQLMPVSEQISPAVLAGSLGFPDKARIALAMLRSREFASRFVTSQGIEQLLIPELPRFRFWRRGSVSYDVIDHFRLEVMSITVDQSTGMLTIIIQWGDQELSSSWANGVAEQFDEVARQFALSDIDAEITTLRAEMDKLEFGSLKVALADRVNEKLAYAAVLRGRQNFAYEVVDRANAPIKNSWPNAPILAMTMALFGFYVGLVSILFRPNVQA